MPRYVILRHELPADSPRPSHWDLMLESAEDLRTWALDAFPRPGEVVRAQPLPTHRLAYLDYEGPVSGHRGHVTRADLGQFEWVENQATRVVVQLAGSCLRGTITLDQTASELWSLTYTDDPDDARASLV